LRIVPLREVDVFTGVPYRGDPVAVDLEDGVARPRNGRLPQEFGAGRLEASADGGLIAPNAPAQRIAARDPANVRSPEKAPGRGGRVAIRLDGDGIHLAGRPVTWGAWTFRVQ